VAAEDRNASVLHSETGERVKKLTAIEERNRRVEADKAWETSMTRRAIIAVFTYVIVVVFLFYINAERPFLMATIPVIGYILSTLALTPIKSWWLQKAYRK
jgi:hypothetical protein